MYKNEFSYEKYLKVLDIRKFRYTCIYVNFRVGAHELEIERGRYQNIPRRNRICELCNTNDIKMSTISCFDVTFMTTLESHTFLVNITPYLVYKSLIL